ncbi:MAG: hypothetical protein E6K20_07785, partial [Gammaproteobacteria bacterium]
MARAAALRRGVLEGLRALVRAVARRGARALRRAGADFLRAAAGRRCGVAEAVAGRAAAPAGATAAPSVPRSCSRIAGFS